MFLVAITGGIATGKSTVTKVFKENGIPVVDADVIARQIVEPGKPAWCKIKKVFGDEVFKENGEINRDALGKIIFNDVNLRRKLNEITHPTIHRTIILQVFGHLISGSSYVVMDLPLLFETGILIDFIHKIITVTCDFDTQVKRLMDRSSLNEEDARKRISAQMPLESKCEKSHFVIDNSGSLSKTEEQALTVLNVLNASNQHWKIRFYFLITVCSVGLLYMWLTKLFSNS